MNAPPIDGSPSPRSLYAHFPFCWHRCHYCDFSVRRSGAPPVHDWLEAIGADLENWFAAAGWDRPVELETIFVGGGTPSLLGVAGMTGLRDVLAEFFGWAGGSLEWTAESNPASLDRELASGWLDAGVTRLSVGVQSFDDTVLAWLGRLHDSRRAREALGEASAAGFENLNLDLIFGLPSDLPRAWRAEVGAAVDSGVTHVSVYGLTAEPRTPLGRRVDAGLVRMMGDEDYDREYMTAAEELERAGFVHYEVSNFALPGYECRHNWHYWDGSPYLGVGPSAHSYLGGVRVWNVCAWEAYRRGLRRGSSPREGFEVIGAGESRLERLWLAFRTKDGLPRGDELTRGIERAAGDMVERWVTAGWLVLSADRMRLTRDGWLRMDEMVAGLGSRLEDRSRDET